MDVLQESQVFKSSPCLNRRRILIVDDNEQMANLCKDVLELSGYEVLTSNSGNAAFTALTSARIFPDLVLLDLQLGDMSGTAWLERLETEHTEIFSRARVIFVSASDYVPTGKAVAMITKPFKIADLLAMVDRFLEPIL